MKDFNKLTDEELRAEVAKALGWTCTKYEGGTYRSYDPANWTWFHPTICTVGCGFGGVPDFPRDLNACHEFEEALDDGQHMRFSHALKGLVKSSPDDRHAISAAARQRCCALLMALNKE